MDYIQEDLGYTVYVENVLPVHDMSAHIVARECSSCTQHVCTHRC